MSPDGRVQRTALGHSGEAPELRGEPHYCIHGTWLPLLNHAEEVVDAGKASAVGASIGWTQIGIASRSLCPRWLISFPENTA
jgi:hypothetical protein